MDYYYNKQLYITNMACKRSLFWIQMKLYMGVRQTEKLPFDVSKNLGVFLLLLKYFNKGT